MLTQRRSPIPFLLTAALLFTGACEDGNGVTDPTTDVEPPSLVLTSAPDESRADHEVALEFTVTDDRSLAVMTIDWGAPGDTVDTIPLEGKSYSGSCVHTFSAVGEYTIVVRARDTSGRVSMVMHEVSITPPPPGAPLDVRVEVNVTKVRIRWTPGTWAAGHEIVVARTDAPEAERVQRIEDSRTVVIDFTALSWDASYTVVVSAVNTEGRAESAPIAFHTMAPNPPSLTRFSAAAANPTCLVLKWSPAPAESYRVSITGDAEADSFERTFPFPRQDALFCATDYPIVDGMMYTAQVFSVIGAKEYGSHPVVFTVDFEPVYSASGSWTATWPDPEGGDEGLRLHLDDADGQITGTWEHSGFFIADPGHVSGKRTWAALELTLYFACDDPAAGTCTPNSLWGEFTDADTIDASLDTPWYPPPFTLTRD
jgi:hypothetical protein